MRNFLIITLLLVIACQQSAYEKLHSDYMNILQAIEEEIL